MTIDCHYCPSQLDPITDEIYFTNSAYGTNHPTCPTCNEKHTPKEPICDYPIKNNKVLSDDFKNFLLSLQLKTETICLN